MNSVTLSKNYVVVTGLFLNILFHFSTPRKLPSDRIQSLATLIGSTIHNTSFLHMALANIQTDYLNSAPLVKPLNGTDLLLKIQASLQDIFLSRVEAVEELAKVAEESYEKHVYDVNLQMQYPKAKNLSDDFERIQDPFFPGFLVNLTQSTVHVPTNVYDESAPVTNGVLWSEVLDEVFVENHNHSPSISWQYFCSSVGFFRNYPGMSWPKISEVDLFDCRTRGWYIQAATSAKDVIILVDSSGSMRGLRMEIARATIEKIMDTFSENDFFNVIKFSEHPEYLEPCFNGTLVQATMYNRQKILDILTRGIKTQNIAYFDRALIEAFELFKKIEEYGHGAKCNKLIMIITDGAPSKYEDIFAKYNWPDKRIRVFTYLIGREVNDPTNVRWIACSNKGYYSHISTLADVHEHVQDYVQVLSRPLVLTAPNHTVWTNIYGDAATTALTTTVAVPVFDIKNETHNDGNLLGVMGTDVVLSILTNTLPKHQLGVHSYAFAITNNGFIIFHPEHRPYYKGKLKQNYNNLDISEVEFVDTENLSLIRDSVMLPIRQEMIRRKTGLMKLRMKVPEDNMRRASIRLTTYYYIPFNYTPFSLGIAVPDGHSQNYMDGRIRTRNANLTTLKSKELKIAPWQYCWPQNSEDAKLTQYELLMKYLEITKKESSFLTRFCHQNLVESLLFDATASRNVAKHWLGKNVAADVYAKCLNGNCPKNLSTSGVELLFIGTNAGLTRYLALVEQLSDPNFLEANTETNKMLYYTRAIENGDNIMTVSVPFYSDTLEFDPNTTLATVSTPVIVSVDGIPAAAGVVGLQMKYFKLDRIFALSDLACSQNSSCDFSCLAEEVDCYLLDNNGYVVYSERPELHLGKFFGEIDGEIMLKMVQNESANDSGIFRRVEIPDYQAMCVNRNDVYSSGQKLSSQPLRNVISYLSWAVRKLLVFVVYLVTMCWCEDLEYTDDTLENVDFLKADENDTGTSDSKQEVTLKDINYLYVLSNNNTQLFMQWVNEWRRMVYLQEPAVVIRTWYENILEKLTSQSDAYLCTKVYSLYVLQKGAEKSLPYSSQVEECKDCEAYFSVHKVPLTNLLLLVVDATCECSHEKVLVSSREINEEESGSCHQFQLNRAAPESCYCHHPDDNSLICGSRHRSPSTMLIIFLLLLLASLQQR